MGVAWGDPQIEPSALHGGTLHEQAQQKPERGALPLLLSTLPGAIRHLASDHEEKGLPVVGRPYSLLWAILPWQSGQVP